MTDIVEEARAMLAESAKYSSHPWFVRGTVHTIVWDARGLDVAEAATSEDAALIAATPRLLAALADECERLRAENARLREAMPTKEERYELGMALDSARPAFLVVFPWLARLDAARKEVL